MTEETPAPAPHKSRPLLDFGPLLLFLGTYYWKGIFVATGVLMLAVLVSLLLAWKLDRRLPPIAILSGVLVGVFGGLTLWLGDDLFLKLKPTVLNCLFAAILFFGLLTKRTFLKTLFGQAFELTDAGWRKLTLRFAFFFLFLAAVNEVVWRNFSRETWVHVKVFGFVGLTMVFTILQVPLLQRYHPDAERLAKEGAGGAEPQKEA